MTVLTNGIPLKRSLFTESVAFDGDKNVVTPRFIGFEFVFIKLRNTALLNLLKLYKSHFFLKHVLSKWCRSYNLCQKHVLIKRKVANFA
jgi:hypothetical protein